MSGTFVVLIVVEIALTAVMVGLWLWRGFLDMKEDDHLLLDDAEAHLQREQSIIRARVTALSRFLVVAGVAWGVLAVAIVGGVIVTELKLV
jgi:hypothetical protein